MAKALGGSGGGFERIAGGEHVPVSPGAIEEELARLWASAGEADDGEPPTLVRVLNFVTVSYDGHGARRAEQAIAELPGRHPGRAISVQLSEDADRGRLEASISAHCRLAESGREVCAEEIDVRGHPGDTRILASTVASLLVPGLPAALWWLGPHVSSRLFDSLAHEADHLILDSADLREEKQPLAAFRRASHDHTALSDLAWVRLTRWREMLAQFFDFPERQEALARIDRVELTADPTRPEPYLLLGWLASALRWRARGPLTEHTVEFESATGRVHGTVRPTTSEPLRRVRLRAAKPLATAFEVALEGKDCAVARVESDAHEVERLSTPLEAPSEPEALCQALDAGGRDSVFERALALAASLQTGS